jgi:hypothetical protein
VATKGYKLMSVGTDNLLLRAGTAAALAAAKATGTAGPQGAY